MSVFPPIFDIVDMHLQLFGLEFHLLEEIRMDSLQKIAIVFICDFCDLMVIFLFQMSKRR